MIKKYLRLFFILLLICFSSASVAQDYDNPDQYYRAMTLRDLDYRLSPQSHNQKRSSFGNGTAGFRGGCPDQINIGGIGENTRVIGSVDINVTIDQDFIIDCNRF